MGDLTVRDEQMIHLGECAETYIEHQQMQQSRGGQRNAVREQYDVDASRREWARNFQ